MLKHWWDKQNARWSQNGGPIAASLWWLAYVLLVSMFLFTLPSLLRRGYSPSAARMTRSLSNLKQIGVALQMYVQDNEEGLPPMNDATALRHALRGYVSDSYSLWHSPYSDVPYVVNSSLSLPSLKAYQNPDKVVAVWDPRLLNRKYYVAAFLDGHAKPIKEAEWTHVRSASGIVKDVLAPPYPTSWSLEDREGTMPLVLSTLSLGVLTAAFLAAWREAWWRARKRAPYFFLNFVGWFIVRFFGYGLGVLLAASGTVFVLYLLLPVV